MSTRLGIVGGGQLGLYLCEAAQALGMKVSVLSEFQDAPALRRADRSIVGDLDNLALVQQLLDDSDVITFDKEDIPSTTLGHMIRQRVAGGPVIYPDADTLLMLKDKALQKNWLQQHGLPTLPCYILSGGEPGENFLPPPFDGPIVQKARRGGFDGRGVQILQSRTSAQQLWDVPSIVEPYLADCREISVVSARGRNGDFQTYPPVSMQFDPSLNSVKTVMMPAAINPELAARAKALAERTLKLLGGVGIFAIEMFIDPRGQLLINEISPRVHNSGHVTLDACNVSQFEQHVRAVCGLPLVEIEQETASVMLNILYEEEMRDSCPAAPLVQQIASSRTSVYWYGKAAGTPGRKMGHINAVAGDISRAAESAHRAMAQLSSKSGERAA